MAENNELLNKALTELSTREGGRDALIGIAKSNSSPNVIETPSVITSKLAKDLTTQNKSYLSNIESGLTTPTAAATAPETQTYGTTLNVPTSATNPAQNTIVSNINNTINSLTPEQRQTALTGAISELLNRINQSSDQELALTSKAREAEETGDYYGLNEATKKLQESQKQRLLDLQALQTETSKLRTQYLGTLTPTAEETTLATTIADFQEQMKNYDLETQKLVYGLEGQGRGIVSGLVAGQQAKLQQQRNLEYQSMAAKESNLLTRLGLLQDARKAQQTALTTGISMLEADNELSNKIRDAIDSQNQAVIDSVAGMSTKAKDTLTFILKQFEGLDFESLPNESIKSIQALAEQAGIDIGIIQAGLKAVKDQQDFENVLDLSSILKQFKGLDFESLPNESIKSIQALAERAGIDIGIIQAGLKAVKDQQDFENALDLSREDRLKKASEKDTRNDEQEAIDKEAIQKDIKRITGSDGYVDSKKIIKIRQSVAINSPELLSWFDRAYPPNVVLNPDDPDNRILRLTKEW
jgi:hypothetical protein